MKKSIIVGSVIFVLILTACVVGYIYTYQKINQTKTHRTGADEYVAGEKDESSIYKKNTSVNAVVERRDEDWLDLALLKIEDAIGAQRYQKLYSMIDETHLKEYGYSYSNTLLESYFTELLGNDTSGMFYHDQVIEFQAYSVIHMTYYPRIVQGDEILYDYDNGVQFSLTVYNTKTKEVKFLPVNILEIADTPINFEWNGLKFNYETVR